MLNGGERRDCALSDISHIGARINIPDSDAIPDNLLVLLAANGTARRRCRLTWRKPRELGVKFETWIDDRIRAATPKPGGTVASNEREPAESGA